MPGTFKGKKMITQIELTETGLEKFNQWFFGVADPAVRAEVVMLEMLGIMEDRLDGNESLVYELERQFTLTGNPELLHLESDDVHISEIDDDEF